MPDNNYKLIEKQKMDCRKIINGSMLLFVVSAIVVIIASNNSQNIDLIIFLIVANILLIGGIMLPEYKRLKKIEKSELK